MLDHLWLADPEGSGSLVEAANWIRALVTGTPATMIATIAVAAVGILMLQGRFPLRRGVTVVLGCFLVFGAGAIADGLARINEEVSGRGHEMPFATIPSPPPSPSVAVPSQAQIYDPYAGASVPVR